MAALQGFQERCEVPEVGRRKGVNHVVAKQAVDVAEVAHGAQQQRAQIQQSDKRRSHTQFVFDELAK